MIIPTKHINFSQSLLGFGSYILSNLDKPKTIDDLWKKYKLDFSNNLYCAKHSFDNLVLTIIFLYSIDVVLEKNGEIAKQCN
jgi:hypothetical protein